MSNFCYLFIYLKTIVFNVSKKQKFQVLLSLWGHLLTGYQLSFFKISAKDTKNTLLILVTQISVIHQSKLLSVYFYLRTLTITTKLCGFGKKNKTNRVRSLSSPSPRTAFSNMSLK